MKKFGLLSVFVILNVARAMAQGCSVCSKAVAGMDSKSVEGLNTGIIYLAFLPLGFIFFLFYMWRRQYRKA